MTAGTSVTRGKGALENFLARQRERMAHRLISRHAPASFRLLDVGCGSFPFFLSRSPFREKYGVDQFVDDRVAAGLADQGITLLRRDVESGGRLPFSAGFFDVVTMLAVFEHIRRDRLSVLMREIHRVLRPGGLYVLTTPASWTAPILDVLTRFGLVSSVEIDEHEHAYSRSEISDIVERGGFDGAAMECGSFELGMNLWACARKTGVAEGRVAEDGREPAAASRRAGTALRSA